MSMSTAHRPYSTSDATYHGDGQGAKDCGVPWCVLYFGPGREKSDVTNNSNQS